MFEIQVLLAMPYKYNEVLWAASEANVLTGLSSPIGCLSSMA